MERDRWVPSLTDIPIKIDSHSWFDILQYKNPNAKPPDIITINSDQTNLVQTEKIRIYPTIKQKNILFKWFELYRLMYNDANRLIADNIYKENTSVDGNDMLIINTNIDKMNIEIMNKVNTDITKTSHNIANTKNIVLQMGMLDKLLIFENKRLQNKVKTSTNILTNIKLLNNILDDKMVKKYVNSNDLRDIYLNRIKNKHDEINIHILDKAISHCVSNYKANITNYKGDGDKRKVMKQFRIRDMKEERRRKIIKLEGSTMMSKLCNSFCVSVLGQEVKSDKMIQGVSSDFTLQYDSYRSSYKLLIPVGGYDPKEKIIIKAIKNKKEKGVKMEKRIKKIDRIQQISGVDPGVRTFQTMYTDNEVYLIGNNLNILLNKYYKKIDGINRKHRKGKLGRRSYMKASGKVNEKISNKIRDMHFKVSKLMCEKSDIIKIGKISTSKIISNKTSNISERSKRVLLSLSHYEYRQKLKHQAKKYGSKIEEKNEWMTSKMCHKCEKKNDVKDSKIYRCGECKMECDRDINSSINFRNK